MRTNTGISLLALTRAIAPMIAAGAGAVSITPAQAQSVCTPDVLGVIVCTPGLPVTDPTAPLPPLAPVLDIVDSLTPINVVLQDGFQSPRTVTLTSLAPGADVNINALGSAVINTINQPGLIVDSAAGVGAQITSITTVGDGATGALLRAVDEVIFVADGTISTIGANAPAINLQGASVEAVTNTLSTVGESSNGAIIQSLNGPASLTADLITTNGNLSDGAVIRAAGNSLLQGGAIRTGGTDAVAFDISNDAAACVLLGAGGCTNTVNLGEVTTGGFGGIGGLVTAAGSTSINIGALRTDGDQAAGLNLSTDPTACAVLGVGGCGTAFTVQNLTTQGASSPGALVRAGGPIVANVGVLETNGDQAIGLDLASQPEACAVVGAGNCGSSFSVGQLTTNGAGATGVLARIAGPTTGNVGVLRTNGDNAAGVDIASDPTVCAIVGAGGCDVNLIGQNISTAGDGAAAVLLNSVGNITTNLGAITTLGDGSTGLSIIQNPAACLAVGPGVCRVNAVTGPVNTGGDNSPGVDVDNGGGNGPTDVATGPVTTGGNDSPGVIVNGGSGTTTVSTGPVTTTGNNSPGVDVSGTGPIIVSTGPVSTSGTDSDGVDVSGGAGPVTVNAGPITTTGASSDGINVGTTSGDQTIIAGPVIVSGPGSNGIVATSPGCSNIGITARDDITSAQGTAILASSACAVTVTTLPGATVTGRTAGIDVTSGTGATITIGDAVSSATGPAIDVDGALANVTITASGSVAGYLDLTDSNDTLTNNGTFDAGANSDFGGGNDTFVNNGRFFARRNFTTAGAVTLTGLESFVNNGMLDMRNGITGDTLTIPGSFTGAGNSTLGVDVAITPNGATADRLVVGGAATGSTGIALAQLQATPSILVNNLVVVDAGAGSSPTAFTLSGGVSGGLVRYNLAYDAAANNYALFGTPDTAAYQLAGVAGGAREIFYRTSDAVSNHMQSLRDSRGGGTDDTPQRASALWGQMFGSTDRRTSRSTTSVFGQSQTVILNNDQDFFGGQIGYDFGSVTGRDGFVIGVTGGYANSTLRYRNTGDRLGYQAVNGGAYASINAGRFFLNGLGKYEHYWIDAVTPSAGIRRKLDGNSYGGRAEAGLRLGSASAFLEPAASIEYVHTDIDALNVSSATLGFDGSEGLRGKAGARLGMERSSGANTMTFYIGGQYVHEFKGDNDTQFSSGGQTVSLRDRQLGDYGRGTLGLNINSGNRVSGFLEAFGDYSSNYKGGGGRGGLSIKF
ncbi:autotransporter outer membrane beta-barrel domain-containing protein [Sphingomonas endolithica]|uniref:autotransporter outer membrane beta-barrel domain-containing protein n=1 Tax=Sphingomonas endolithica TaxID=2972485 RepID=UPI0021AEF21B|nr:autotransporter outer membrane beta-barrel domain-containing protein [Sphingomonas sp. ZFBP2030]